MSVTPPKILLTGSLAAFSPHEIMQWLCHHPGEGMMRFEIPADQVLPRGVAAIEFDNGWLKAIQVEPIVPLSQTPAQQECPGPLKDHIGGLLVAHGTLSPGDLRYALLHQEMLRRQQKFLLLGEVLGQLGLVEPDRLREQLKELGIQTLAALILCRRGRFTVTAGRLMMPYLTISERLDHILLQAAQLSDTRTSDT
jgi:Domain of unknown function (DUF4388)